MQIWPSILLMRRRYTCLKSRSILHMRNSHSIMARYPYSSTILSSGRLLVGNVALKASSLVSSSTFQ